MTFTVATLFSEFYAHFRTLFIVKCAQFQTMAVLAGPVHYSCFVPGHKLVEPEMCPANELNNAINKSINTHSVPIYFSILTKESTDSNVT